MDRSDRFDRILEKENRPPTRQNRVLEKQTRRRPPEKSDRSAVDWVRSAGAGGSGWPGLWTALALTSIGIGHCCIAVVFLGSVYTPSPKIRCPKYSTSPHAKTHVDFLANS